MPLDVNNRILISQGLKRIRAGRCVPGIRALLNLANRSIENLTATDSGLRRRAAAECGRPHR